MSFVFCFALSASSPHYDVKLTVDWQGRVLTGKESIRLTQQTGPVRWDKHEELSVQTHHFAEGSLRIEDTSVEATIAKSSGHVVRFEYTAAASRGFRWLTKEPGLFTAFYCAAWMVCDSSPGQRATLRLEIVVKDPGLRAVGPGVERKSWRDAEGQHWIFETPSPVQTYLWSFAVARLQRSELGGLEIFAPTPDRSAALRQTADAVRFYRERTGLDAIRRGYRQVFMAGPGVFGQEAAGLALMTEAALKNLESGDVVLMAHELAHQWWGVSVAIRSWSDFWLNEGVAEYVSLLYLKHVRGNAAFLAEIEKLKARFAKLRSAGKDRPLHFEGWTNAEDALGPLPYVKGALFLHRLRTDVGDAQFWKALSVYSRRHAGELVDSRDFQRAFEEVSERDLGPLFGREVYGR